MRGALVALVLVALSAASTVEEEDFEVQEEDFEEEERQRASGALSSHSMFQPRNLERTRDTDIPDINDPVPPTRVDSAPAAPTRFREPPQRTFAKEEAAKEARTVRRISKRDQMMPYNPDPDSPIVNPDRVTPRPDPPNWVHEPASWWLTPPWWIVTPPLWSEAAQHPDASEHGVWAGEGARASVDISFLELLAKIDDLSVGQQQQQAQHRPRSSAVAPAAS